MDSLVAGLFVLGLLMLTVEVFVPGAVIGVLGALSLLAGVAVAFAEHGVTGGLLALLVAIAAGLAVFYVEVKLLPRTALGRRMFLRKSIDGASQPPIAETAAAVVGRDALARTALAPSGVVEIDGRRYEARCESGFVAEGATVRVRRVESFHLVVIASD